MIGAPWKIPAKACKVANLLCVGSETTADDDADDDDDDEEEEETAEGEGSECDGELP